LFIRLYSIDQIAPPCSSIAPNSHSCSNLSPNHQPLPKYIPFLVSPAHSPEKGRSKQEMGDFVQQSITKTAVRELSVPIENITTFNTLVAGIISVNPWGCTAYDVGGVPQSPVSKGREGYPHGSSSRTRKPRLSATPTHGPKSSPSSPRAFENIPKTQRGREGPCPDRIPGVTRFLY